MDLAGGDGVADEVDDLLRRGARGEDLRHAELLELGDVVGRDGPADGDEDVVVTVGGTIPADDIPELKELGVAEVFTPGATTQDIIDFIQGAAGARS